MPRSSPRASAARGPASPAPPAATAFSHLDYCGLAGGEVDRFAALIPDADPALRVPTCGRWKMRDLVHHTGAIHRWADGLVAALARKNRARAETDDWEPSATPAEQSAWIAAAHQGLLATLRAADPEARMYAWGADQHVRFWSRRMTHETGIHRADAELALGVEPSFRPAVAADGVGEFLANLWKARAWRWNIGKLRGEGEVIRLASTDTSDEWTITLELRGIPWSRHDPGDGPPSDVTVRAPATDLYLMVWGRYRCDDDRFVVAGDADLLAHWQRNSAV
jgi:uncharacterized protein (TIGR03083 family)